MPQSKTKNNNLKAMRRALVYTAWIDYKIFGYQTDAVKHLARQIQKAKKDADKKR